jgi:putative membrane protein
LITTSPLPTVNATLNFLSAVFLVVGFFFIKSKRVRAHKASMLAALTSSACFLISYLIYHYQVGSVPFRGQGFIRSVYFTILISHTILAVVVVPMALLTVTRAFKGRFAAHRRIACWTFPVWLYVSVTGVLVYWMLYWLVPSA